MKHLLCRISVSVMMVFFPLSTWGSAASGDAAELDWVSWVRSLLGPGDLQEIDDVAGLHPFAQEQRAFYPGHTEEELVQLAEEASQKDLSSATAAAFDSDASRSWWAAWRKQFKQRFLTNPFFSVIFGYYYGRVGYDFFMHGAIASTQAMTGLKEEEEVPPPFAYDAQLYGVFALYAQGNKTWRKSSEDRAIRFLMTAFQDNFWLNCRGIYDALREQQRVFAKDAQIVKCLSTLQPVENNSGPALKTEDKMALQKEVLGLMGLTETELFQMRYDSMRYLLREVLMVPFPPEEKSWMHWVFYGMVSLVNVPRESMA